MPLQALLKSPDWYNALSAEERLASLRSAEPDGVERTFDSAVLLENIELWRSQRAFANSRLACDPKALYGCTLAELSCLLCESSEDIHARSEQPEWLWRLAQAFERHGTWLVPETVRQAHPDADLVVCVSGLLAAAELELIEHALTLARDHRPLPFEPYGIARHLVESVLLTLLTMLRPAAALELNAARLEGRLEGSTAQERFQGFVQQLGTPVGAATFLHEYPVLARILATRIETWVQAAREFLSRLAEDWINLRTFPAWKADDTLTAVKPVGDPHRGGRRVMLLRFASGFEITYKPRSLAAEGNFQKLLLWVNERAPSVSLRSMKVLDRGDYGWEEMVRSRRCTSPESVAAFYRRQGAELALLRTLGAVDMHYDNIVADAEQPMLVDLETLFHRVIPPHHARLRDAERIAAEVTANSVIYVGLLPYRILYAGEHPGIDMSGMGADASALMPISAPTWDDLGTDLVHQELRHLAIGKGDHRPLGDRDDVTLADFAEDVVEGFSTVYRALLQHREQLLDSEELGAFHNDQTRCLLRPTLAYAMLLLSSYHPHFLQDGLVRDRRFDRLIADSERLPQPQKLIQAERHDLWNGDIPLFWTYTDSTALWDSRGVPLKDALPETGLELVTRRLMALSDEDLARETWVIRMAIATWAAGAEAVAPRLYSLSDEVVTSERDGALEEELESQVRAISERLTVLALTTRRDATWIGIRSRNGINWWVDPVGPDLYDGLGGIALFLAYAGVFLDAPQYTELARAASVTMRRQIDDLQKRDDVLLGGFSGLGGNIYSLTHLAQLLGDASLLDAASRIVSHLPRLIAWDTRFDVVAGAAGCIKCLLGLHRFEANGSALEAAVLCGDHLLSEASRMETGIGWIRPELGPRPLAGFGHGGAGAAWALLELSAATGETRFRTAAHAAIAYERTLYSYEHRNWRDIREHHGDLRVAERINNDTFMRYWCNGAAGIGLGRLASNIGDGETRAEIAAATTAALGGFGLNHCLCHGDLGNLELLVRAEEFLPVGVTANGALVRVLDSMERHGWVCGHPHGLESPGLMLGLAGIGLGLLRLARPATIPCVLLLDPPSWMP
jgi:type 2 lantibiotic biosynthesis protein LanM